MVAGRPALTSVTHCVSPALRLGLLLLPLRGNDIAAAGRNASAALTFLRPWRNTSEQTSRGT